jgi:membrane-associated phospholipid phosphatase
MVNFLLYLFILMEILFKFGEYGPLLLLFLSWYSLWNNKYLFFYFNIGLFLNTILNLILKGIIQQPRPLFDNKNVYLIKSHVRHYFYHNGIPFNIFGMPSGHAQLAFFMTIFIYLSLHKNNLLYLYLFYSLFICYQRVKSQYHSIPQVIFGAIVGSVFGYFIYKLASLKIKGKIRVKPDDFAPI